MTPPERALLDALRQMGDAWGPVVPGYEYRSPVDLVLRKGRWFPPRVAPTSLRRGLPKHCFGHSINIAAVYGLRYVEGYALSRQTHGLPVHHAWNLTADGRLVDLTWGVWRGERQLAQVGVAYLGVEFSVERADDATWNGNATVLDDYERRWPVLREPWRGEPEDVVWPPSPRLDGLRAARDGDPSLLSGWLDRWDLGLA